MAFGLHKLPLLGFAAFAPLPTDLPLDASGDRIGAVIQCPLANAITKVAVWVDRVVGTSPTYKVSLQGVTASGLPDGTVLGGGSPASATFTASGTDTPQIITLDNSYTPSLFDSISIVIEYDSGTIDASNFADFAVYHGGGFYKEFTSYAVQDFSTGTWSKPAGLPVIACGTSSEWFGELVFRPGTQAAYSNASSPNERGMKFTLPARYSTFPLYGVSFLSIGWTAGGTVTLSLYEGSAVGDTTATATATIDTDLITSNRPSVAYFDSIISLSGGTTYRISLRPDSTNTIRNIYADCSVDNTLFQLGAFEGSASATSRGGGNWTDDADQREWFSLIYNEDDVTYSSGGIPIARGMHGGMRG